MDDANDRLYWSVIGIGLAVTAYGFCVLTPEFIRLALR